MILKNAIEITGAYQGKTKFAFISNLKEGDIVIISIGTTQKLQGASNGLYATNVNMKLKSSGEKFSCSMTEFERYIAKIPHTEAKEFYTRNEVVDMLEDVYAKTAGSYNDYGKDEYDYRDDATEYVRKYMGIGGK